MPARWVNASGGMTAANSGASTLASPPPQSAAPFSPPRIQPRRSRLDRRPGIARTLQSQAGSFGSLMAGPSLTPSPPSRQGWP
jgi:hypothetical protein